MIRYFATPFNVVYRTRGSVYKKIASIEEEIEFEKYKLQNNSVETLLFTEEENKARLRKLKRKLEYYQAIIVLKDDETYTDGLLGGEIIIAGTWLLGTVIGLGINKLKK